MRTDSAIDDGGERRHQASGQGAGKRAKERAQSPEDLSPGYSEGGGLVSQRHRVARFWDDVVNTFFAGGVPHLEVPELRRWFGAYAAIGRGAVAADAFPEPYIGPLAPEVGQPRVVALGLNPGEVDLAFQGRDGIFSKEMRERGGFSRWAVTAPYLREPWRSAHHHNRYHAGLHNFARQWLDDPSCRSEEILVFELFPWHSDKVTRRMRPDPELVDRFVWGPLSEVEAEVIFAFGKEWGGLAERIGLPEQRHAVHFSVPTRQLRVFQLHSGQQLAVVWQPGYSGPPGPTDVAALRTGLSSVAPTRRTKLQRQRPAFDAPPSRLSALTERAPDTRAPSTVDADNDDVRHAHLHAFARHASAGLIPLGFGPVRVPSSLRFLAVRWPRDLWYRELTQQGDLHVNITLDSVSLRVHIDAYHGDRRRNEAEFDRIRDAIESLLLEQLPSFTTIDWRAAGRGANQVCAVTAPGGLERRSPEEDARWVVAAAEAWLLALRRHPSTP